MIITRTPFRVSFAGGGSDIVSFYEKHGGCVLSTAINKYMYISVHPSFDRQKTVLKYLDGMRSDFGTAILLISHDLGVIAEMADEVAVMQNGRIVENRDVFQLFDEPKHEYTKKLLSARLTLPVDQLAT